MRFSCAPARLVSLVVVSVASLLGAVPLARAQTILGEPSAYRFYVAPGPGAFLGVDGTAIGREWEPSVGLLFDYAHRPFALDDYDCLTGTAPDCTGRELDVVAGTATLQLSAAIAFADLVQIGINLPFVAYTWGDGHRWSEGAPPAPRSILQGSGTALGDPRLHGKVRLFDQDLGGGAYLGVAIALWVTFPVAQAMIPRRYAGEPGVTGGGHVAVGFRVERLRAAINLGAGIREEARLLDSRRTSELTWGAAVAYDFDPVFGALVELQGQTTFGLVFDDEAPTEIRAAGLLRAGDLTFTLGAGAGIAYAIGVPVFRVFGGAQWEPRARADTDGDGLHDEADACPADAEDLDGHADEDGCPDLDNDGDGIPDATDGCPDDPEDVDQHEDEDGCPDRDDDGDGVLDGYDSCPTEPEDVDGDRDTDGCPDADRDRDNIPDDVDQCPDQAEDTDGLADEDGCPEEDFDADGIPDVEDECADRAEDRDGFEDDDGCPEEGGRRPPQ